MTWIIWESVCKGIFFFNSFYFGPFFDLSYRYFRIFLPVKSTLPNNEQITTSTPSTVHSNTEYGENSRYLQSGRSLIMPCNAGKLLTCTNNSSTFVQLGVFRNSSAIPKLVCIHQSRYNLQPLSHSVRLIHGKEGVRAFDVLLAH